MHNKAQLQKTLEQKQARKAELKAQGDRLDIEIALLEELIGEKQVHHEMNDSTPLTIRLRTQAEKIQQQPDVRLFEAVFQAGKNLQLFTKWDLQNWIRKLYPKFQFSIKSLDKPLKELISSGQFECERKGIARRPSLFRYPATNGSVLNEQENQNGHSPCPPRPERVKRGDA